ncbi:MAG TPA: type II toxin-antitoxin system VapC family toxin [Solirubrobacterales bacterium]|nr:type II toxin-antitoxin system VapC family toxin [Solirubrobacterales bacterium]
MRLLLDTNALLWILMAPDRLRKTTAEAIRSEESEVWASVVSPWEFAIKASHGKLRAPDDLSVRLDLARVSLLPISLRHADAVASLPHHHRDPFDRMLVAQAQVEGLTLVTSDRELARYQVALLPAL